MSDVAVEDPFALVGTTLDGQYRVEKAVGQGGFGVVYRATHLGLEQPVAIKVLKALASDDPRVQEALYAKFRDEAKLLYTLSQASLVIVRAIDFGAVTTEAGFWAPYMVLEWLPGRSLEADLEERRARGMRGRSLDEAMEILAPVAEGLALAHARRVAHRDVKPANVFLVDAPGGAKVKVLDFGIAKLVAEGETSATKSAFASFTWLYAAPEQLDPRHGPTGLATDVYAFVLVLVELLTDRTPVDGRDVVSLLRAASDERVRPTPRTRGASVPDAFEAVCARALSVDPRARHADVGELWRALVAARGDDDTSRGSTSVIAAVPTPRPTPRPTTTAMPISSRVVAAPPTGHPYPGAPYTGLPGHGSAPLAAPSPMPNYVHARQPVNVPPRVPVPHAGNDTVVLAVVAFVVAGMIAGGCALMHACAGG